MDRYPAVVYLGSAVLGKVGAEHALGSFVVKMLPAGLTYVAEGLASAGILVAGRFLSERTRTTESDAPRPQV
jgi:hypothetical protein